MLLDLFPLLLLIFDLYLVHLLFGLLCSIPYIFTGTFDGGLLNGFRVAFTWWVAGIPFDLIHGIGNLVIMLILYHPVKKAMQKASEIVEKE